MTIQANLKPWETAFLALREAAACSETVDVLLRKTLAVMNLAFNTEGMLWVGLDETTPESCRVYSTDKTWKLFGYETWQSSDGLEEPSSLVLESLTPQFPTPKVENETTLKQGLQTIRRFRPDSIPLWLVRQREHPRLIQLKTGDLIVPVFDHPYLGLENLFSRHPLEHDAPALNNRVTLPESYKEADFVSASHPFFTSAQYLRFVFQFRRSFTMQDRPNQDLENECTNFVKDFNHSDLDDKHRKSTIHEQSPSIQNSKMADWSVDEVMWIQSICHQLVLACDSLALKRNLEQFQRHSSLLGRTAHILNTSIHPDLAIQQILAEMGQSMRSDRVVVFDLRHESVSLLKTWEHPRKRLAAFSLESLTPQLWQDSIDLFVQGGSSHLTFQPIDLQADVDVDSLQAWLGLAGIRSALILPIFIREAFFGAIAFLSHRHDRMYAVDELQMARQNTDQLSIALAMIQYSRSSEFEPDPTWHEPESLNRHFQEPLTKLLNRDALEEKLEYLSKPSVWAFRLPFSLIVCDIDYFKLVNDNHGHDVGDKVLQRLALQLQRQLRHDTLVYRYGGEEFAILLEETELHVAKDVAERLRQSIRNMDIQLDRRVLSITASFGVSQLLHDSDRHGLDVFQRAEKALFEAKLQGRDRVVIA